MEYLFGRSIGAGFANPFTTGPLSFPTPGTLVPVDCFDILLLQPHCAAADSCPKRPAINTPKSAAHGLWPKIYLKFDTVCQQRMCWEMLGDRSPFRQLFPVLVALRDRSKMVFPSAPSLIKKCLSSMLDRLTCSGYHTGRFMRHLTTLCVSQCMSFEHFVGWRVIQYSMVMNAKLVTKLDSVHWKRNSEHHKASCFHSLPTIMLASFVGSCAEPTCSWHSNAFSFSRIKMEAKNCLMLQPWRTKQF